MPPYEIRLFGLTRLILVLLLIELNVVSYPNIQAQSNDPRNGRCKKSESLVLNIYDLSAQHILGSCPVYSAQSEFSPYPKFETHLPVTHALDIEVDTQFKVGSVEFYVKDIGQGVDNIPPFRLSDAIPNLPLNHNFEEL